MPREYGRNQRIGSLLQQELAGLIRRELKDPRAADATISEVRVGKDLGHARVFVSVMDAERGTEAAEALNHAAGFLRHRLRENLDLRAIPSLHFVYDDSIRRGVELVELIEKAVREDRERKD